MNVAVVQEMWCSNVFAPKCGAYSKQELLKVNTMQSLFGELLA